MNLILIMAFSLLVCRQMAYRVNYGLRLRPSTLFSTSNSNRGTAKSPVPKTTRARKKSVVDRSLITLPASAIAAIIDKNPYRSADEIFNELWLKNSPETFRGQTKSQLMQRALDNSPPAVKNAVYTAMRYKATDGADAVANNDKANRIVSDHPDISPADKAAVSELMRSRIFMIHGARTEGVTAAKIEVEEGAVLLANNKLYRYDLCRVGERQFQITGKIDRLEQQGMELVLVEIKNRMNGLFGELREYEHIQVQTYLQMIPGDIRRAKLVEQYLGEHATHLIQKDDELWHEEILPVLNGFCERLQEAMQSGIDPTGTGTGTGATTGAATAAVARTLWVPPSP
jgi:hypothetical protein